jgi:hypothetical protein
MASAVTGGGLTVIANSPNPAGQPIRPSRFGEAGISPPNLFLGALVPTESHCCAPGPINARSGIKGPTGIYS